MEGDRELQKAAMKPQSGSPLLGGFFSKFPLLGRLIRRYAISRLLRASQHGNPRSVSPLVNVFLSSPFPDLRSLAEKALRRLSSPACINLFCSLWAEGRNKLLEKILVEERYIADYPILLTVLTALKVGDLQPIRSLGDLAVEPLVGCLRDADAEIRKRASSALRSFKEGTAAEILSQYALQTADPELISLAKEAVSAVKDPAHRAFLYFLTERWEDFENLDYRPDRPLLNKAYGQASEPARRLFFEVARRSGRSEVASLVRSAERRRFNARTMKQEAWESILRALLRDRHLEEAWRLCFLAPLPVAAQGIKALAQAGFNAKPHERELFERLLRLCPERGPVTVSPGQMIKEVGHLPENVENLCPSPQGNYIACCLGQSVRVFSSDPFKLKATLTAPSGQLSLACATPDEKLLVTAGKDRVVRLWSLPGGKLVSSLFGHRDWISCMAIDKNGKFLATGSKDSTVRVWSLPSGKLHSLLLHGRDISDQSWILCMQFVPQKQLLVTGSKDSAVRLWDISEGQRLKTLDGHRLGVLSLSVGREGRFLATGCKGGVLQFWSLPEGKRLARFEPHGGGVLCTELTPDGLFLLSAGHDGTICMWDTLRLELLQKIKAHSGSIAALKVTPDASFVISGSSDGRVGIWRLPSLSPARIINTGSPLNSLALGSEGRYLFSAGQDKKIRVWHLSYLKPLALATHKDLEEVTNLLQQEDLPKAERAYWEFFEALLQGKFRYDIIIEKGIVTFEPYDIEIETHPEGELDL